MLRMYNERIVVYSDEGRSPTSRRVENDRENN